MKGNIRTNDNDWEKKKKMKFSSLKTDISTTYSE